MAFLLAALLSLPLAAAKCTHAIVGGGPGGVYTAWRLVTSLPDAEVCLFERSKRLGGRIASIRNLGPHEDLVVEAGAYRFVPVPECEKIGQETKCEWTPLARHLIKDALKLKTALYDPFPGDNSKMEKIVDENGHNAGYATFVETMAKETEEAGRLHIYMLHEVTSLRRAGSGISLSMKGPDGVKEVEADAVLLNVPQLPLLRLLSASAEVDDIMTPREDLFAPRSYAILKLYVYYEDAWWRNYLNLTAGQFSNMGDDWWNAPYQFPLPLEGRYWDGDFRCDSDGRNCRGFLEAIYGGGDTIIDAFRPHMLAQRNGDPIVVLDSKKPMDAHLLKLVHRSLVAFHAKALKAAGKLELVNASFPETAVLSSWTGEAAGFEAGCHDIKAVSPPGTDMEDIRPVYNSSAQRLRFVRPLGENVPVFLADEAFGWPSCWAESSLVLAENAVHAMAGLGKPSWLPEDIYKYVMLKDGSAFIGPKFPSCGGDPFVLRNRLRRESNRAGSNAEELVI